MLIGRWTRECGCGCRAVLSSNNSSTAIARWDSVGKLIRMAITLGNFNSLLNEVSSALEFQVWFWLLTSRNLWFVFFRILFWYRRYLPILKNFPTRYIHEPWNAPLSVQRAAKCIIGKDYSLPMVNHSKSSRINIERMKQVYQQLNKYRGNGVFSTRSLTES